MLFSMYPRLLVNTITPNTSTVVTDIFRRISMNKFKNNLIFLQTITVPDGYTIEQVADKYYDNPEYHWVIMIINNIVDVRKEWPMSNSDLLSYCKKKYGDVQIYQPHHYQYTDGSNIIVDFNGTDLANGVIEAISNYQYEEQLNNGKREIKMLESKYLGEFVSIYAGMIGGN
jgi:hypothetical protein